MAEHLEHVAVVRLQERRVDLTALRAQLSFQDPLAELEVVVRFGRLAQEALPLAPGDEEERMVPQLALDARIDLLAFEVRIAFHDARAAGRRLAETDRA